MARQAVGSVIRVTPRGGLLVKAPPSLAVQAAGAPGAKDPQAVRIGSRVVDARNAEVGRVTDVIGPVASPYVLIAPGRGAKVHRLQGKELYLR